MRVEGFRPKRLYVVRFTGGKQNRNWAQFFENVISLNGKAPDYGGIQQTALISHHVDKATLKRLCCERFRGDTAGLVVVEEITRQSLQGKHRPFADVVENYFLRFKTYPRIESREK